MHKYIFYYLLLLSVIGFSQTSPGVYTIKNLDKNSKVSDFGTSFYKENTIIFSSSRGGSNKKWDNGQSFLDLYEAKIDSDGQISKVKNLSSRVNSEDHESNVAFTPDFKTVYFTGQNIETEEKGKKVRVTDGKPSRRTRGGRTKTETKKSIYFSIYKADVSSSGKWSNIESLHFNSVNYMTGHPSVNKDGTKLYFVSDMPGSYGESDIYVVDIGEDGTYSRPKNLGAKINSSGREMFPFIDDNDVLYFSSDVGDEGLGGLDIYAVKIYENSYSEVVHLGNTINTEKDDFALIFNNDNNEGYFSSNREGGKGDDDIYHFVADPPIQFGCSQTLTGVITDSKNQNINGAVITVLDGKGDKYSTTKSKENGSYSIKVPCDSNVVITGSKAGYNPNEKEVAVLQKNVQANLQLEKLLCLKTIIGVVTDTSFGSLDGVTISIVDSNGKEYNTVSEKGRFSAKVPCDIQLKVKGVKEGYGSVEKNATADSDMETKLPIKLQLEKVACLKTIEGVVTDNSFSSLNGVAITIIDNKGKKYTTTSKSQGKFSMEVPCETTLKIKGTKEAYIDDERDYTVDNNAKTPLNVKLQLEKIIVCMQSIHVSVENSRTSKPVSYAVVTVYGDDGTAITSKKASDLGQLTLEVPCNKVFKLKASKDKYKENEMQITSQDGTTNQNFVLSLELIPDLTEVKILKDKVVVNVNPIYFPLNSAKITPTSAVELNKVVAMMQKYPTLRIEGASHTDSRGRSESNMVLSGKRANSTVRYIINQGIDSKRITAQGYGETQPVNGCIDGVKCTNTEYQLNRRTEFVILNPDVLGYY